MKNSNISKPRYPRFRKEMLDLVASEQDELTQVFTGNYQRDIEEKLTIAMMHCHRRAKRVIEILDVIKKPTIDNIGRDGSEAFATLTMHSYLGLMKRVLKIYTEEFEVKKNNIASDVIPALYDRVMILEKRMQAFGTQWMLDEHKNPFLIWVEDLAGVNDRRSMYRLGPVLKPKNLTKGAIVHPIGQGNDVMSCMKKMSNIDYETYAKYYLRDMS